VIDLTKIGAVGVYGREKSGKSNLVRNVMDYLQSRIFDLPCEAYLIDDYDKQLSEFNSYGFVQKITVDCAEFEDVLQIFTEATETRMEMLRTGKSLDKEPLLLCVVQNPQIFATDVVSFKTSETFKKLLADSKRLKICFMFANVSNIGEFTVPEMLKQVRTLPQFFLLDDITNVKLFGSSKFSTNDLREYKKPISIGDGYVVDSTGELQKVKLVKQDRR